MIPALPSKRLLRALSSILKDSAPTRPASRHICLACRGQLLAPHANRAPQRATNLFITKETRSASSLSAQGSPDPQSSSTLPDISSHYSIFPNTLPLGPPPAGPFNIDLTALRREFLQLQSHFHPDKSPPDKKAKAEALSSRINEAYKTLRDPLLRAQYILLNTYGIDVTSEDNSAHPMDVGILMEVMEAQESMEEAETEKQIMALKEQNQERIDVTLRLLDDAFTSRDAEVARRECIRLRYWASLAEGLNAWDGKGSEVRLAH